jgi:hypothetical protein
MIMAILGGDDAGGGVIWALQVIEDARDHGLVLGENGKLYDTKKGQSLPDGVKPMPLLTDEELKAFPEMTPREVVGYGARRYNDLLALAARVPVTVIGEKGVIRDKPGFQIAFLTRGSSTDAMHRHDRPSVLMPMQGHWKLIREGGNGQPGGEVTLNPGGTASVPAGLKYTAVLSMTGEASLYHVVGTDDPAGHTWLS